jgi:hypothetical protein
VHTHSGLGAATLTTFNKYDLRDCINKGTEGMLQFLFVLQFEFNTDKGKKIRQNGPGRDIFVWLKHTAGI